MKSPYCVLKNQMNGWVRRAKCPCWSASSSALPGQCRGILLFHRPFSGTRCNRNNFAWKMQGWLHPGGSGSSLSTFCVWETSLCAGHTRLAVLLSISWVLAMTVTIFFFFFFPNRKLRVRKTRILWALRQNQLSAWTVWYQGWEDLFLQCRMLFSSFIENPQRQCWMTWEKGPGSFFQRRTLCFKSCAFGVEVGGGEGGWILLPLSKLAKST